MQGNHAEPTDALRAYRSWASSQARVLGSQLSAGEVDRLVTTKRYWVIETLVPQDSRNLRDLLDTEISERLSDLKDAIEELRRDKERWTDGDGVVTVVLDTNILEDHLDELASANWHSIASCPPTNTIVLAVPMAVVDELDGHKRNTTKPAEGESPLRTRARLALKFLEGRIQSPGDWVPLNPLSTDHETAPGAVLITIAPEEIGHVPIAHADSEIVDRALALKPWAKALLVLSNDTGMRLRARAAGIEGRRFREESLD